MKRFLILTAALSVMTPIFAQSVINNPDNSVYWGIRASVDINLPSKWSFPDNNVKMYKTGAGAHLGAICNIPLVANLYMEPGVGFYYDTYRFDNLKISNTGNGDDLEDPQVRKFGLRVPVMLGYRFDLSQRLAVSLFTGPELNWSLWGDIHVKSSDAISDDLKEVFDLFDKEGGQYRVNVAWDIGASMEIDYNWVISVTGSIGMNDMQRNTPKFRENRISISLGYNF